MRGPQERLDCACARSALTPGFDVGGDVTEGGRPVREGWEGHGLRAKHAGKLLGNFEHIINVI